MLHYYIHDGPTAFRFALAGVLGESDARRLEQDWRTASSTIGNRILVVDLSGVTGVDDAGRKLLRGWHQNGARFVAESDGARRLAESITGHMFPAAASPARAGRGWLHGFSIFAAIVLLFAPAKAATVPAGGGIGSPKEVLAHYLASSGEHDPLDKSSTVAVDIQASLPSLEKSGHLTAIRYPAPAASSPKYQVLRIEGDATVKQQVIARYLSAEKEAGSMPASSVAISEANYKFRYIASVDIDGTRSYVFRLTPRKKRNGLIKGQLWIDAATGTAVQKDGFLVKSPSMFIRRIEVASTTTLRGGQPWVRVTHVTIDTRLVGPAELTITERPYIKEASGAMAVNNRFDSHNAQSLQ